MYEMTGIARTKEWFELAVPNPTLKNIHTQLGCHFEEVAEMVGAMKGKDRVTQSMLTQTMISLHALALHLKAEKDCFEVADHLEMLDGICDQIVTATGSAHMLRYNIESAYEAVNRSNFSKFVDDKPVFDANMKIQKGPDYFKPNLLPYLP